MFDGLKKLLSHKRSGKQVEEFLSFALTDVILRYDTPDYEKTYTEYASPLEELSKQMSRLSKQLKAIDSDTFNLGTLDLISHASLKYDEMLGQGFGDKETKQVANDYIVNLQCYGPRLLSFALESCTASIEHNVKQPHLLGLKGSNPDTRSVRELVARLAAIYGVLGGVDSHTETSQFALIVEEALSIIGVDKDPCAVIKRAKEQSFYSRLKESPTGHPSFEMYKFYFEHR